MAVRAGWTSGYSDGWAAGYDDGQGDTIAWLTGRIGGDDAVEGPHALAAGWWCLAHNLAIGGALERARLHGEVHGIFSARGGRTRMAHEFRKGRQ